MHGHDRIARFDDFEAVRFVQHFGEQILQGCSIEPDALEESVDSRLKKDERVGALLAITPAEAKRKLGIAEAAPVARAMLALWSADPAIAPALEATLNKWRDDDLAADVIVSVGYIVSLWICVASIGFEGTIGTFKIKKKAVPVGQISKLIDSFAAMIGRAKGDQPPRAPAAAGE